MKKSILITGATGFIGKNLIGSLKSNYEVSALVKDLTKAQKVLPDSCQKIKFFLGNDENKVLNDFQTVIHLAADVDYFARKQKLYQTNVAGTKQLITSLPNLKHFIYAGSIEAAQPKTAYGQTKKEAEDLIIKLARDRHFALTILRLGNVYGPDSPFLFSQLKSVLTNPDEPLAKFYPFFKDIKIFPVFINDVVQAFTQILAKKITGQFTLSGPKPYTIAQIIKIMGKTFGLPDFEKTDFSPFFVLKSRLLYHRLRARGDFLDYLFAKAEQEAIEKQKRFPFKYQVNLTKGIKKTL